MPVNEIEQLESSLEAPANAHGTELASRLSIRLGAVTADAPKRDRELTVRGLMALHHHYYRVGDLARARAVLANAYSLSLDLDAATRAGLLLRLSDFELLTWDIGAALAHTAEAMEVARDAGLRVEEARAWTAYGMALQAAGLVKQADQRLAHALDLLVGLDEPRIVCNIWALRSQLGCHLTEAVFQAAAHACEQALVYAEASPPRYRDGMACTAWCNRAALEILRGDVATARQFLQNAAGRANLDVRPRWLIAALEAMADIRENNDAARRDKLAALLEPDKVPALAYVIETYSVMAAMYTSMGDGQHAHEALMRLSTERARALWATLRVPGALERHPQKGGIFDDVLPPAGAATASLLERLAITAELRDDSTGKHCYRVGRLAMLLARRASMTEADAADIDLAARLHDIGKFAIPDAILLKPARLNDAEMQLMRTHTTIGADLLAAGEDRVLHLAEEIARHHHEHWNGQGYPVGLAGDTIPMSARITAIADVYDALSHVRPYKLAWSHQDSVAYIENMRGTQFDPRLVDIFLAMMAEAHADLASFLDALESAATTSSYVMAESRISKALIGAHA